MIKADWSKAPEWAEYWAVNFRGHAYWYDQLPKPITSTEWDSESGVCARDQSMGNWKESLEKRP